MGLGVTQPHTLLAEVALQNQVGGTLPCWHGLGWGDMGWGDMEWGDMGWGDMGWSDMGWSHVASHLPPRSSMH